jgi:glutaredoxin
MPKSPTYPVYIYVSNQCPSCVRLLEIVKRLRMKARVVNIDVESPRHQLTAVPTIVAGQGKSFVGTNAFMYLQDLEDQCPLDDYALVSGEDLNRPYTNMETDEMHYECPFAHFAE